WSVVGPARDNPEAASIAYVDTQIGVWFDTAQAICQQCATQGAQDRAKLPQEWINIRSALRLNAGFSGVLA
ncbi:hypothetical protein, partial [Klebsiella pneumoniae]|uniref:hypothetical protein n=1 Tax=Klebsiella pneumoniae TaxID=573 RepID=UPI001D0DFEC8